MKNKDSLEFLKGQADYSADIIYSDPPYALGSEVIIRPDGKVDYKNASDFMNKWEMPTGDWWSDWFEQAYRSLKHGGYCVMFGMDRQLLLFKYYAQLAGFTEKQSLYWYFISNFPKATDLSKMLDKNAGAEREVVGNDTSKYGKDNDKNNSYSKHSGQTGNITAPSTDLAKKYSGYKYSISPLKQTNETIMVFQKPTKTGSPLHDTLAYENGDETITVSAVDIDGNRVGTDIMGGGTMPDLRDVGAMSKENTGIDKLSFGQNHRPANRKEYATQTGRYPSQTFISPEAAEVIDRQSGVKKDSVLKAGQYSKQTGNNNSIFAGDGVNENAGYGGGSGGASKILHKCPFEDDEHDLYFYNPKVSKSERNAGLDGFEDKVKRTMDGGDFNNGGFTKSEPVRNNHPTLKPISLNTRILKLFKTPNPQRILLPFAGSGSEVIGAIKAGYEDWEATELNPEYVEIAKARIEHWSKQEETKQMELV